VRERVYTMNRLLAVLAVSTTALATPAPLVTEVSLNARG
jgi:hypothetical protein